MTNSERITRLENLFKTIASNINDAFEPIAPIDKNAPDILTFKSIDNA